MSIRSKGMRAGGDFRGIIQMRIEVQGEYGRVLVRDNGTGIEDISRALMYRPKGLGFHLPFAMNVIKTYWKGWLSLDRKEEGGTTVVIALPLVREVDAS